MISVRRIAKTKFIKEHFLSKLLFTQYVYWGQDLLTLLKVVLMKVKIASKIHHKKQSLGEPIPIFAQS